MLEIWKHHGIVDTKDIYTNDINTLVALYKSDAKCSLKVAFTMNLLADIYFDQTNLDTDIL